MTTMLSLLSTRLLHRGLTLGGPALVLLASSCGGAADGVFVGTDDDGGRTGPEPSVDAAVAPNDLARSQVEVAIVQRSCTGDCAEVEAVAYGAYPPYTFRWEDGSTNATRTICGGSEATLQVTARDNGSSVAEFPQAPTLATASPSDAVLSCSPVTVPEASTCETLTALPSELTPPLSGELAFFADGATLPAGRYVLEYVDGCVRFDPSIYFWTVNGFATFQWLLVQNDKGNMLSVAPGVSSLLGYLEFEDCIAANRGVPPLDFEFAGGKLGIYTNDFRPVDNLAGEAGRSPKWRLSQRCK